MAFCKYCGKPLEEGEVCSCAGNAAAQQAAVNEAQAQQMNNQYTDGAQNNMNMNMNGQQMNSQQMNGQQMNNWQQNGQFNTQQMQQKANEYMQQGMEVAGNTWKNLLEIFKAPAEAGRRYVAKSDMVVSIVLIALQAVIAGIFGLICAVKVNSAFSSVLSLLSTYSLGRGYNISLVKGFFITLLFSLIFSAIFALIFFAAGKIVKAEMSFNKALAIASIRSAAVIPFMLAGCVLILINVPLGIGIFYLGNVLAICYIYASMTGICEENKLSYVIAAAVIVFLVVTIIIMSKAVGLYVPSGFKSLSGLSNMMNMFY